MSIGKKCDRCGKFYVRNQVKQENGRYIIRAALIDSKNCVAKRWDICDECAEELQAFMSNDGGCAELEGGTELVGGGSDGSVYV